jgi:hypothetical protein
LWAPLDQRETASELGGAVRMDAQATERPQFPRKPRLVGFSTQDLAACSLYLNVITAERRVHDEGWPAKGLA